jgi:GNAT superfamily N-acetyltransferase
MDKTINPLGADPEFFIELKDGTLKSIIGLIGGSKDNPKIIDDHGHFKIQEDNVAAEYNIPPAYTRQQWIDHILWPQKYIAQLLGTDKFRISTRASASFPMEELQDPKAMEVERIYVLGEFQSKKVGQLLFEKALAIGKNKKVDFVWLGVWEENHRAIRFYTKNGFIAFDSHIFLMGNDKQTDILMKLQLL